MRPPFVVVIAFAGCAPAPAPAPAPALAHASAPAATPAPAPASASASAPIDTDGDRIPDADDECPNDAENYNGYKDEDGCPDNPGVIIATTNPPPVTHVYFGVGSAKPVAEAKAILEEVAAVMKAHPEIDLVQIEGHAAKNEPSALKLSQLRAEAVRDQVVSKGVDGKRLRAKGFAAHCPAPFKDAERRVELKVVTKDGKPTGTELGCAAATAAGIVSDP